VEAHELTLGVAMEFSEKIGFDLTAELFEFVSQGRHLGSKFLTLSRQPSSKLRAKLFTLSRQPSVKVRAKLFTLSRQPSVKVRAKLFTLSRQPSVKVRA
jgi:hypothetical protein